VQGPLVDGSAGNGAKREDEPAEELTALRAKAESMLAGYGAVGDGDTDLEMPLG
jgi:hypothetical protein